MLVSGHSQLPVLRYLYSPSSNPVPNTKAQLESALCCLKLSLSLDFHLRSLYVVRKNSAEEIWLISTLLMILVWVVLITPVQFVLTQYRSETLLERIKWPRVEQLESPATDDDATQFRKRISSYLVDIGQVWPSELIPLSNPIMCCCVVAPGTTEVRKSDIALHSLEVSTLILSHYSRYWKLGNAMLRKPPLLLMPVPQIRP